MPDTPAQAFIAALHALEETKDPAPLAALYTENAVVENVLAPDKFHGPAGAHRFWTEYRGTFGEARSEFRNVIETADRAALEWTTSGTGFDGGAFVYSGVTLLEMDAAGHVTRSCAYFNPSALGRQVEGVSAP